MVFKKLDFFSAFQNIAPLQVGGIVAVVAVVAIVAIVDMGFGGCGLGGMEEIKKSASPKKNCGCGGWRGLNVVRGKKLCKKIFYLNYSL